MAGLVLRALCKSFGGMLAVDHVDLDIPRGEFFSILGPSGCGKTTLLRLVAGFEQPTSGGIELNGQDILGIRPQERGIGMVFQNYALFPHMNVFENVAYSLRTRRLRRAEIARRVDRVLQAVRLEGRGTAAVPTLSGGEQQRVAVARALAMEPALLLFDEPLSNLDVTLRVQTREEIRSLQQSIGITALYVTHDQSEAMSLSDRMAIMRAGRIEQVGTPVEVYSQPTNPFVARFLGGANLVDGTVTEGAFHVGTGSLVLPLPPGAAAGLKGRAVAAIKPEAVIIGPAGRDRALEGRVEVKEYLGHTTSFVVSITGLRLHGVAESSSGTVSLQRGDTVFCEIDWSRCTLFPAEQGK